jgi:hypothetical protein
MPGGLKFSPETEAKKKAFEEFSAYRCNDCEGGRGYDAWIRQSLDLHGEDAFESKVGGMGPGQSLSWKGHGSTGTLTVVADEQVGRWPCKRVSYTLKKATRGAQRPGLFCLGRPSGYAAHDHWIEVF